MDTVQHRRLLVLQLCKYGTMITPAKQQAQRKDAAREAVQAWPHWGWAVRPFRARSAAGDEPPIPGQDQLHQLEAAAVAGA